MITSLQEINETGRQHYKKQIRRRNSKNPSIIKRFADRTIEINDQLAFEVEIERLDVFIEHLACALFLAHFGDKWHGDVGWLPESFTQIQSQNEEQEGLKLTSEIDLMFNNIEVHGKNKEVFKYQVVNGDGDGDGDMDVKMRLHFYGRFKVLLLFLI